MYHNLASREIRLFTVEPGVYSSDLRGCLRVVAIDDKPRFHTLSYCWIDDDYSNKSRNPHKGANAGTSGSAREENRASSRITLDGQSFEVTRNLEAALRYLRLEDQPRTLWIDAICINQANDVEKAQQVAITGDIYASAEELVIWAGPASEDSHLALQVIHDIAAELPDDTYWNNLDISQTTTFQELVANAEEQDDATFAAPWLAIQSIFLRRWWTRAWTVQEVFRSRGDIKFVSGQKSLPWGALSRFHFVLMRLQWPRQRLERLVRAGWLFSRETFKGSMPLQWHRWKRGIADSTLLSHLTIFENRDSTNLRDNIYAYVAISTDIKDGDIAIDYRKPIEEVFTAAAIHFARRYWSLKFLALCQTNGRTLDLPSWVPDWTLKRSTLSPGIKEDGSVHTISSTRRPPMPFADIAQLDFPPYSAGTKVVASLPFLFEAPCVSPCHRYLTVKGLTPATIKAVGEGDFRHMEQSMWRFLELVEQHVPDPYLTGETRLEAFWRTLIANRMPGQSRPDGVPYDTLLTDEIQESIRQGLQDVSTRDSLPVVLYNFIRLSEVKLIERVFFVASNGSMGLAPADAKIGDQACLIFGLEVPLILRKHENGRNGMQVIGEAYVHNLMDGEKWSFKGNVSSVEDFVLA